jgi:cytochrome c oxidase cbb3-type subunit I/II
MSTETIRYDNKVVLHFLIASTLFGVVGMMVGLLIAMQLTNPAFNLGPWLSFGRIRPLHTNAVIFAFVGNALFMGIYYSLPRLCKTPMISPLLSKIHFWGWQAIIVSAVITLPLGITSGKEYAELEWPIDIAITLVWVAFGINMLGTIYKRRERHMYVAIWFYVASWLAVAILHIVNSIELPFSYFHSFSYFAGVQDALVQWWYGHNAVAFFLTTPYLGMMYYFLPKAANRPVFSYRLSIIHFWALVFIYMWAGPHHLLYSAVPDWAQSLGTVFSLMLIAPSWGGMLNGLLTLRGAWDRVREDAALKFMVVAITCYGMATFEGPMLSLKNVNALAHYTDYIIGHVHVGGLGWNGCLTFGVLYWLVPKLFGTKLYSQKLASWHFWLATLGIIFYAVALYFAGITQGLMWSQFNEEGDMLKYPNFLETVLQIIPMYYVRALGGSMYLIGALVMCYNLWKTAREGDFIAEDEAQVPTRIGALQTNKGFHRKLEGMALPFTVFSVFAVIIGGLFELVPVIMSEVKNPSKPLVGIYSPLELEGREIYRKEGCVNCHSQMIRPFRAETERYGDYAKPGDYVYEHPFLWGSRRIGPDLQRIGERPDLTAIWHYNHMIDPQTTSPDSIMPPYPWLAENELDLSLTRSKMRALRILGVPYSDKMIESALTDMKKQAEGISRELNKFDKNIDPEQWQTELIALIAYLKVLGVRVEEDPVLSETKAEEEL